MCFMEEPMSRILIVRLSAVGDTILSLPIACALRRGMPEARIGWVVGAGASTLLTGHDCIDDLIVLSKDDQRTMGAYMRFLKRVRDWKPDVVIDAQGLTKSAWIGWCSGARKRIGLCKSEFEGRELSTWLNNELVTPQSQHVALRGLELLIPLGIAPPHLSGGTVEYRVPTFAQEFITVERSLCSEAHESLGRALGTHWAAINVGAGWPSKIWPSERYAGVAKHLQTRWGMKSLVIWGGEQELAFAKSVVERSDGAAVLAPKTTLRELAEWIRRARMFVGSDTGPMHLAVAVDVPTVALIGPMPIERVGPIDPEHANGLEHASPKHASVQIERLPLSAIHRRRDDCRPMLSIEVEHVAVACDRVLDAQSGQLETRPRAAS